MEKAFFDQILFGGDYNPEQWPEEVWKEDVNLLKKANINSATVNVFSWAKLQPSEEEFDFRQLDKIMDMLAKQGMKIVFATPTAAAPAWMFRKYPEIGKVDYENRRHRFGKRQCFCPNSEEYRRHASLLVDKLAARYHNHPNLVCWHVNNEYGAKCYCKTCEKKFQGWLKNRYGTLEHLNKAWNTGFWSFTIYDWEEIVVPNVLSSGIEEDVKSFAPAISLDYARFMNDATLENFIMEKKIIRKYSKDIPVTTNFMGTYKHLDYFKWAQHLDVVSWDCYPEADTPSSFTAMNHDLMRGLKNGQSFMLMEQTPSQATWQPCSTMKAPGVMRAQSYQALAHGADTVQFFQLRKSIGGCEQFHGAVIDHAGHGNTRIFREISQLGRELQGLGNQFLGAVSESNVGIVFDWENYWAVDYAAGLTKEVNYVEEIHRYYAYFHNRNIPVDMLNVHSDFSKYDLVIAPVLYMLSKETAEKINEYVKRGGSFVTTYLSGLIEESYNVHLGGYPGLLREVMGIWVEEIVPYAIGQREQVMLSDTGQMGSCDLIADVIHLEQAQPLAWFASDYYKGMPAVTVNQYGEGSAYYVGTRLEAELFSKVMDGIAKENGILPVVSENTQLEVTLRRKGDNRYYFVINHHKMALPLPKEFVGERDMITGRILTEADVEPAGVFLINRKAHS